MSLYDELKRRNVIRVAIGYLAAAWLLIQIVETLSPTFGVPDEVLRGLTIVLAVGLLPAVVLTWVFEWTPEGLVKDRGDVDATPATQNRRFDRIVMSLLAVAVAYLLIDKFILPPPEPGQKDASIAVLVFDDLSPERDHEYFAMGITEELLNLLARYSEMRVISKESITTISKLDMTMPEIAELLGVTYLLEGSIRKAGDKVRITAQLIDGPNDEHVWSETYDREFRVEDVFKIQDEIASQVVGVVQMTLLEHDVPQVDPAVYEIELQVRYLLDLYDPAKADDIWGLIEQGLELAPDNPALLWQKYRAITHRGFQGLLDRKEVQRQQAELIDRLREVDTGEKNWLVYDISNETNLRRKADMIAEYYATAPNDAGTLELTLRFLQQVGQFESAFAVGERLVDIDPLCGRCYFRLGNAYLRGGDFETALARLEKARVLGTGNLNTHYSSGLAHLFLGRPDLALLELEQTPAYVSDREFALVMVHHDLGNHEAFDALFAANYASFNWYTQASVQAWTENADAAFELLEAGLVEDPDAFIYLFSDASYMRIMDDPRWHDLMRRAGTSPDDIAALKVDIKLPAAD